jgi:hypothetical protein
VRLHWAPPSRYEQRVDIESYVSNRRQYIIQLSASYHKVIYNANRYYKVTRQRTTISTQKYRIKVKGGMSQIKQNNMYLPESFKAALTIAASV